ncbi:TetR/AcrR family transcriptional regulator [Streptomonospora salina]|uniref:AcrR family transcriptional regulator n=1 Tax=Streptomonospora salina TaxID=104205 RepID=A0A841EM53_9ACTN|nr:TetR/AcrR family transcriptional regulator [Streptomonospora salina]MBB6000501.1 AcrR family transcriptional regulator [Streptomonospora salina]
MARPTTAERGREVRRKLLDTACELIAEHGWTAVSTRMLADRAGVTPGLVHYHFSSVQALLREAATGAMRDYLARAPEEFERAATAQRGLDTLFGDLDRHTGLDPLSLLFTETYLASTRDGALRREIAVLLEEFRGRVGAWLDGHGVAEPDTTAAVLAAAVDGVLLHRALDPGLRGSDIAPVLGRILAPARVAATAEETDRAGDRE